MIRKEGQDENQARLINEIRKKHAIFYRLVVAFA